MSMIYINHDIHHDILSDVFFDIFDNFIIFSAKMS